MKPPYALIDGYFEGLLNDEQFAQLVAWIKASPDNARLFARWTQMRCQIGEHMHSEDLAAAMQDESDPGMAGLDDSALADAEFADVLARLDAPDGTAELVNVTQQLKRDRLAREKQQDPAALSGHEIAAVGGYLLRKALTSKPAIYAYAAAVAILALVLINPWGASDDPATNPPTAQQDPQQQAKPVATLTATHQAQWSTPGQPALAAGQPLYPNQRLTLTAGFAQITTAKGAKAIIQAPATFELLNNNAIRLHAGKLVGICQTESSKRFLVRTAALDITDLGTEFGVDAQDNRVITTVFVGEVELAAPGGEPKKITHNQTATLRVNGNDRKLVVKDRLAKGFTMRLPREPIVMAAKINLEGFKARIVPQGVLEDAKFFADRPHEINGIDANGIPSILLGGDLVQMPVDASKFHSKHADALALELSLDRPCDLYLLFPEVEPHHQWLKQDFEPTALRVGIDREGGFYKETLGVGPGVDIDGTFSVWKYKHTATGRVTVTGDMNNAMYAIVAVPKEERGSKEN